MSKVDGSLGSVIQGVSQQNPRERLAGQCTEQVNLSSDPVYSLLKRGGTKYIASLFALTNPEKFKFHHYNLGVDGQYILAVSDGIIKVSDLQGNPKVVNIEGNALNYINTFEKLSVITSENTTFIANSGKTVEMLDDVHAKDNGQAIVHCVGGNYGRSYKVELNYTLDGVVQSTLAGTYNTPDGSTTAHASKITTDEIIRNIWNSFKSVNTFDARFDSQRTGDVLHFKYKGTQTITDMKLTIEDGDGGLNLIGLTDSILDVGKLPRLAPQGYKVKVVGDGSTRTDDFYLQFDISDSTLVTEGFGSDGKWLEAVAPDIKYKYNRETMPHTLSYDRTTQEFTFSEGAWEDRTKGDDNTNPLPSFVGGVVESLQVFQSRLVILSGPNTFLSRTNEPFESFRQTIAGGLLDSDPIDQTPTGNTETMRSAIKHNRDLVIFSDNTQYIVFGRNALTPRNTSIVETAGIESNLDATPVVAGNNIIFSYNYGKYTGIKEFFTEGAADINNARTATDHVPKFIRGKATHISSSTNFNKALIHTDTADTRLYLYEYLWNGSEKVQNSWSYWDFYKKPLYSFFVENLLYLLMEVEGELYMLTLDLDVEEAGEFKHSVHLDSHIVFENVNKTFTLPYPVTAVNGLLPEDYTVICIDEDGDTGLEIDIVSYDDTTRIVTLEDDLGGQTIMCGSLINTKYTPTMPKLLDRKGKQITTGTLIVDNFFVQLEDSGDFDWTITTDYTEPVTFNWSGRILDDPNSLISVAPVTSATVQLDYYNDSVLSELTITSRSHLPLRISGIEWVGDWRKRGTRV